MVEQKKRKKDEKYWHAVKRLKSSHTNSNSKQSFFICLLMELLHIFLPEQLHLISQEGEMYSN